MGDQYEEGTPAQRLRLTARASLLRVYMKKKTEYTKELEETVRWFALNAPDHLQYQEYLRYSHQRNKERLRVKRQPQTLLGKLFRRRTIS